MEIHTALTLWDYIVILLIVQIPVWAPLLRELFTMPDYDHRDERDEYNTGKRSRRKKRK